MEARKRPVEEGLGPVPPGVDGGDRESPSRISSSSTSCGGSICTSSLWIRGGLPKTPPWTLQHSQVSIASNVLLVMGLGAAY